ncbi:hypothetical protein HMPREF0239_01715 [Clostridium sp. ATCC BAA-442]|uniref:Uncharacterized protein n=1 Tax=Flavonifractor plautii ATCC 29863 TaxID=411475 RepID=G9YM39_FLAPL|nr:hypothetical protein HMPREF0372_00559 [Flavonifractor plautii ATCC 29863]ERI77481.1 hypothetical protein HMPREF0239_01715 [Clostridium sp. ATCC BAA-442]
MFRTGCILPSSPHLVNPFHQIYDLYFFLFQNLCSDSLFSLILFSVFDIMLLR